MDSFVNIEGTGNLLVLKTLPGNAQSIGAILDQIDWPEVLGTICGDDTCLLICRDENASNGLNLEFLTYYKDAMNVCYRIYQSNNLPSLTN